MREWSFFVLVASEASSSACIRNAGDWYSAPLGLELGLDLGTALRERPQLAHG